VHNAAPGLQHWFAVCVAAKPCVFRARVTFTDRSHEDPDGVVFRTGLRLEARGLRGGRISQLQSKGGVVVALHPPNVFDAARTRWHGFAVSISEERCIFRSLATVQKDEIAPLDPA
jgi:hypothetical protein